MIFVGLVKWHICAHSIHYLATEMDLDNLRHIHPSNLSMHFTVKNLYNLN